MNKNHWETYSKREEVVKNLAERLMFIEPELQRKVLSLLYSFDKDLARIIEKKLL